MKLICDLQGCKINDTSGSKFTQILWATWFFWPPTLSTMFPPFLPRITLVEDKFVCAYTLSLHPSLLSCYCCYLSLPGCGGLPVHQTLFRPKVKVQGLLQLEDRPVQPLLSLPLYLPGALTFKLVLTLEDILCSLFQAQLLLLKRDPDI